MFSVIAINGSPRKNWNTATLLEHALRGATSEGADTELVHLYDLDFKGCTSGFACKEKGGKCCGECAMRDGLNLVLGLIDEAVALILGSPIYFGIVTGEMRSFLERVLFPNLTYTLPPTSLFGRTMPTAFIYTMNASEEQMKEYYAPQIRADEHLLKRIFGQAESLCSYETLQFEDYGRVVFEYADPEVRRERNRSVFPEDCRKAFDLGARLGRPPKPVQV